MPYLLHKGAYFEVLESILADPAERVARLGKLRAGAPLADLCGFDSTNLGTPPDPNAGLPGTGDKRTPDDRVEHFNRDWLGMTNEGGGGWAKQPEAFPTGFWGGFQGDPEAILRATLERAIEVSMDLAPGAPVDATFTPPRLWPIDIYWLCQCAVFQSWVLWRESDVSAEGHVTVLFTTPAAQGYPLTTKITRPLTGPAPYTASEYACPPPPAARRNRQGMWLLGHEDYLEPTISYSTVGTPAGDIQWPGLEWRASSQSVVCVAPAEWEGGVLHAGRPHAAPT